MIQVRTVGLCLIILLLFHTVDAQKAPKKEWTIFQQSKALYQQGKYEKARQYFQAFIDKYPDSRLLTANHLMLAKIEYRLNEYQSSLDRCKRFLDRFPQSSYTDDIHFLMGKNYYKLNRLQTAAGTWLYVAEHAANEKLAQRARALAEDVLRYRLDEQDLLHLEKQTERAFARHIIWYHIARHYQKQNLLAVALPFLEKYMEGARTEHVYYEQMKSFYEGIKNQKSKAIRIGALLPLSGANKDIGNSILRGARLAAKEYNSNHALPVEIVAYDYETDLITAIKKYKEAARDPSIVGIYGPLSTDMTAACAALADYEKLPVITPTASSAELHESFGQIVQLSTPVDMIGRYVAQFVMDSLQVERVITFAPLDDYFINMTDAFSAAFQTDTTKSLYQEWYYPGDQDFSGQFRKLKRRGLKLAYRDSVLNSDSLNVEPHEVDSLYRLHLEKARKKLEENDAKIDSADIAVRAFDAIFMPVYRDDIKMIAPQIAYANIQAQMIGNEDWYDLETLKNNRYYVDSLIIASNGYLNEEDWDYRNFRNNFRNMFSETPDRMALTSYDSFNFILNAIDFSEQKPDRGNFLEILMNAPHYRGIYKRINIGAEGFNRSVQMLQYFKSAGLFPLR